MSDTRSEPNLSPGSQKQSFPSNSFPSNWIQFESITTTPRNQWDDIQIELWPGEGTYIAMVVIASMDVVQKALVDGVGTTGERGCAAVF